jgi:hypothetical protein
MSAIGSDKSLGKLAGNDNKNNTYRNGLIKLPN